MLDWSNMCKYSGETANHLLLHGPIARELWIYGIRFVWSSLGYAESVLDMLACWQGHFGHHQNIEIWKVIPYGLMWCTWWEGSARSFKDCKRMILNLKCLFFKYSFDWMLALGSFSSSSPNRFV